MEKTARPTIIRARNAPVFLPPDAPSLRQPHRAVFPRQKSFLDTFEDRALIYDCFWQDKVVGAQNADSNSILMIGPPPINLENYWRSTRFISRPSGKELSARFYISRSVMTIKLTGGCENDTSVTLNFAGMDFNTPINQNLSYLLNGQKLLFTMSRDNPLHWIERWANFHALMHDVDAIVLFDNGSSNCTLDEIEQVLGKIPQLKTIVTMSLPFKYGARDGGAWRNHYWSQFLQVSSMSIVLRRMAQQVTGLLNADIDELMICPDAKTVFDRLRQSQNGLVQISGRWIEAYGCAQDPKTQPDHLCFKYCLNDFRKNLSASKWAMDPKQSWAQKLDVFPYMHRVFGAPKTPLAEQKQVYFGHFKGINTNWKETRLGKKTKTPFGYAPDLNLVNSFDRYKIKLTDTKRGNGKNHSPLS